jgi:nicotinamidase-related amidase
MGKINRKSLISFLLFLTFSLLAALPAFGQNSALIIIDMQPQFVTRGGHDQDPGNIKKVNKILENQVAAIEEAKKAGIPIVFLEYENFGDTNKILKTAVKDYDKAEYFKKNTDGMFSEYNDHKKELVSYLDSQGVENLIITGANGGACVKRSIAGSLGDGKYNVYAYSQAIADFNYTEFIFPYDDKYSFKSNTNGCSFNEVDCLADVVDVMSCSIESEEVAIVGEQNVLEFRSPAVVESLVEFDWPREYGAPAVAESTYVAPAFIPQFQKASNK